MYMRQNIVSHFMSLCSFGRKTCISFGAKTDGSDTLCPKRQDYVTLDYDRNETIMSHWISAIVAITKMSLRSVFAPN